MTIRPIIELGHPVLRTPADEVRAFDRDLAALVRDLEETVDHPGRAGLAAPQIGVGLRVFSYNIDGEIGHLVNPTITEVSEETQDGDEGCLSIPDIFLNTNPATTSGSLLSGLPIPTPMRHHSCPRNCSLTLFNPLCPFGLASPFLTLTSPSPASNSSCKTTNAAAPPPT